MPNNSAYAERRVWSVFRVFSRIIGWALVLTFAGQFLESVFFPVSSTEWIKLDSRTDKHICWRQKVIKHRDGKPRYWVWEVSDWDRDHSETFITTRNPHDDEPFEASETTRKGEVRIYRQCIDLPKPLQGMDKALIISARGGYEVWHGLWRVPRFVGPYMIWKDQVLDWR